MKSYFESWIAGRSEQTSRALAILDDPERQFAASPPVKLGSQYDAAGNLTRDTVNRLGTREK